MKLATLFLTVVAVGSSLLPAPCSGQSGSWKTLRTTFLVSYDMVFTSDDTGYVAGQHAVLRTTDGGTSFHPLPFPVDTSHTIFESMSFPTHQIGYVCGYIDSTNTGLKAVSVLMKTTDGGGTWIRLPLDSSFDLFKIDFPTPIVGYYMAYASNAGASTPARLAKTIDGGMTWKTIIFDDTFLVSRMSFRNENEGFFGHEYKLMPTSVRLFYTGDGLATSEVRDGSLAPIGGVTSLIPTSDGAWLITTDYRYARSIDNGRSWKLDTIPGEDFAGLLAASGRLVFEANQSLSVDTIHVSTDYGLTWPVKTGLSDKGFIELMSVPSKKTAYLTMQSDTFEHQKVIMKWTNTDNLTVESLRVSNGDLSVCYNANLVEFRYSAKAIGNSIQLYDMMGRTQPIELPTNSRGVTRLNASRLKPGVYFAALNGSRVKFMIGAR